MGQRLNIEVMSHGKVIANSYYHWSAYSNSAAELAKEALESVLEHGNRKQPLITAIHCLESTGAGFDEESITEAKESLGLDLSRFARCRGRIEGILEVSEIGMESNRNWEEGRVTIDLDSRTANFQVCGSMSFDNYIRYRVSDLEDTEAEAAELLGSLRRCNFDFSSLTYDDLINLIMVIEDEPDGIVNDGLVIEWIL